MGKKEEPTKRITCHKCKSILEYTILDVTSDPRGEQYVECPVCKAFITV